MMIPGVLASVPTGEIEVIEADPNVLIDKNGDRLLLNTGHWIKYKLGGPFRFSDSTEVPNMEVSDKGTIQLAGAYTGGLLGPWYDHTKTSSRNLREVYGDKLYLEFQQLDVVNVDNPATQPSLGVMKFGVAGEYFEGVEDSSTIEHLPKLAIGEVVGSYSGRINGESSTLNFTGASEPLVDGTPGSVLGMSIDFETDVDNVLVCVSVDGVWSDEPTLGEYTARYPVASWPKNSPVFPYVMASIDAYYLGDEFDVKFRLFGSDTHPFNYTVPTGFNVEI